MNDTSDVEYRNKTCFNIHELPVWIYYVEGFVCHNSRSVRQSVTPVKIWSYWPAFQDSPYWCSPLSFHIISFLSFALNLQEIQIFLRVWWVERYFTNHSFIVLSVALIAGITDCTFYSYLNNQLCSFIQISSKYMLKPKSYKLMNSFK